ncbi:mobilization protein MobC [Flavobacterium croceum DSM 17960]|uniref:Mobilization protein MobC n=1 Tax=Flavobacterium croceum DSM 17960 TaxID=1121886 RepID=A0A2S4N590_9FLAO|nr:plasmid mobilization relaxosome protein MobC [Flavobacterium croceum]POS00912.1 mobilization protein MobC [Flavobacterium croceum DSM 17960]
MEPYKKKTGRPKQEIHKSHRIQFLVNDDQKNKLDALFEQSNYKNRTDMFIDIFINNKYQVYTLDHSMFLMRSHLLGESKRIGTNLNQLVKHLNREKLQFIDKKLLLELHKTLQEIEELYIKINATLVHDS